MLNEETVLAPVWLNYFPNFLKGRLRNRHSLHKIIPNISWLVFDKILRMGVGLFVGVWVARYLGPEKFGIYSYAVAFVTLFSTIASLGLDGIVVRDIVRNPATKEETLGTAFLLRLVGGTLSLILSVGTVFLVRSGDPLACWLVGIIAAGMIFQAFDTIDFWFQSQVLSKYVVYARNLAFLLVSVVKVILILVGAPLISFALAGLAEIIIASAGLVVVYKYGGYCFSAWRSSLARAKTLLSDSWPLILSSIVGVIYLRIDQIMIGNMVGDAEVGIYSAAVKLAEVWYFIPTCVLSSVLPAIVICKVTNENLFYTRLQTLYNWMAFISYLIAIPTTFMAGWIIELLFGIGYAKAGPMLAALIWAGLFINLGVARSAFLTANNWTKVSFFSNFLGCIINIGLNLILIPKYGGMGAVIASIISYWIAAHGSCYLYAPMYKTGNMLLKSMIYPKIW